MPAGAGGAKRSYKLIENLGDKLCTNLPFGLPPPWGHLKLHNFPPGPKRAQTAYRLFVPLIFSTPFCKNRYQIIAVFTERCCFICTHTPRFCKNQGNFKKSLLFQIQLTAFAPNSLPLSILQIESSRRLYISLQWHNAGCRDPPFASDSTI